MPCCSAYDALSLALLKTTKKATKKATKRKYDCKNDACFNELNGHGACPPGRCKRDQFGNSAREHARPKCKKHDADALPFGRAVTRKTKTKTKTKTKPKPR